MKDVSSLFADLFVLLFLGVPGAIIVAYLVATTIHLVHELTALNKITNIRRHGDRPEAGARKRTIASVNLPALNAVSKGRHLPSALASADH